MKTLESTSDVQNMATTTLEAMEAQFTGDVEQVANFYNSAIAETVDNIDTKIVPASLKDAENYVEGLAEFDDRVRTELAEHTDLKAETDQEIVADLHDRSLKGLDNWRMTPKERSEWALVVGTATAKHLSPKMQSIMESLSSEDGKQSTQQKLAVLKKQAHDRLQLDSAIVEKYGNDDLPRDIVEAPRKGVSHRRDAIADVVKLDVLGRAHHEGGSRGGRIMEKSYLEQIENHADQIREGLAGRNELGVGITPEAAATQATLEAERADAAHAFAIELGGSDEAWSGLTDEQRKIYINQQFEQAHKAFLATDGNTDELWGVLTPTEQLNLHPYKDIIPSIQPGELDNGGKGRWARIKERAANIKAQVYTFATNPVEYMHHVDRRKKVIAGAIGVLAAAAAVTVPILLAKHGMQTELPSGAGSGAGPSLGGPQAADIFHGGSRIPDAVGLHAAASGVSANETVAAAQEHIGSLAKGSNPWVESHNYLQSVGLKNPTNEQIAAVDAETMRLSGINVAAAQDHLLSVGTQLRMPSLDWLRAHGILG